ncbi:MAG: hypothetical protein VCC00_09810 [Deltaproteobacteria bacterium]
MVELDTGMSVSRLADVPAAARAVEELGFSGLWAAETGHDTEKWQKVIRAFAT